MMPNYGVRTHMAYEELARQILEFMLLCEQATPAVVPTVIVL